MESWLRIYGIGMRPGVRVDCFNLLSQGVLVTHKGRESSFRLLQFRNQCLHKFWRAVLHASEFSCADRADP